VQRFLFLEEIEHSIIVLISHQILFFKGIKLANKEKKKMRTPLKKKRQISIRANSSRI